MAKKKQVSELKIKDVIEHPETSTRLKKILEEHFTGRGKRVTTLLNTTPEGFMVLKKCGKVTYSLLIKILNELVPKLKDYPIAQE